MKRNSVVGLLAVLLLLVLVACRNNNEETPQETVIEVVPTAQAQPPEQTDPNVEDNSAPTDGTTDDSAAAPGTTDDGTAVTNTPTEATPVATSTDSAAGGQQPQTGTGGAAATHTVVEREWTDQIARCYGTSSHEVVQANNLPHPGWIMAGEVWTIPNPGSVGAVLGAPCIIYYTVQPGDTLNSISRAYSVPVDVLTFVNYGCYGYNAHYGYNYYAPVPTLYGEGGAYSQDYYGGYGYLGGCYYYSYPWLYTGDLLVIPVNAENMHLR